MSEERIAELYERIHAMTEDQRLSLDPIADALEVYQRNADTKGWRFLPNRIVALAAIEFMNEWERTLWDRE